jgi:hypothetical protein
MNTEHLHNSMSPLEYAALIDAAKVRAMALRRQALRDFWLALGRGTCSVREALARFTVPALVSRPGSGRPGC